MTLPRAVALFVTTLSIAVAPLAARAADDAKQFVVYEGKEGPGKGKGIVFISGDEEYRSEEGLPMLAKILSQRHGFTCTVCFAVDPKTGEINPNVIDNIPGLEALDHADLMVILTRWRALPEEQFKHVDAYLNAGKPVIGLRTATHAFNKMKAPYDKYNDGYRGKEEGFADGFGRIVLGEHWISHHGGHKSESTRGVFAPGAAGNPLLNGIKDGEIWGPTDVYGVRLPLPGDSKPLILGQVVKRDGPAVDPKQDPFFGMRETDKQPVAPRTDKKSGKTTDQNDPMMPVAWTKSYQVPPDGKPGKAFATTMGSSTDLTNEALRRLLVNATYSLVGLPVPEKADVAYVGEFTPSAYGFNGAKAGVKPSDLMMK